MNKNLALVECVVNGKEVKLYVDERESLLICFETAWGLHRLKKAVKSVNVAHVQSSLMGRLMIPVYILLFGQMVKISVHWKGLWNLTGNLPRFSRHLLMKAQSSADSVHLVLFMTATLLAERGRKTDP